MAGTYNPQVDGIVQSKPTGAVGFSIDRRTKYADEANFLDRAFLSTAEVIDYFDTEFKREGQFVVLVNSTGVLQPDGSILGGINEEWWWANGLEDEDLIRKDGIPIGEKNAVGGVPVISDVALKSTISQIRALGGTLKSSQFYTTDKGKEGEWYYDASDTTSVDNLGTVLVSTDGKRFKRVIGNGIKPEWFGAKGDGTVDDAIGINLALQAVTGNSRKIVLTKSEYLTSTPILINQDNVVLDGGGSSKIKNNISIVPLIKISSNNNTVSGIFLDGNMANLPSYSSEVEGNHGISITGNNNIVTGCDIYNIASFAVYIKTCSGNRITNNYIHDLGAGIQTVICNGIYVNSDLLEGTRNTIITDNIISRIKWPSSIIERPTNVDANGIQIQGIDTTISAGEHKAIVDTIIANNIFEYCPSRGIKSQESRVTVNANRFIHCGLAVALANYGICRNFTVTNNSFEDVLIACSGSSGETINYIMTGNIFKDVTDSVFRASGGGVNRSFIFSDNIVENVVGGVLTMNIDGTSGIIRGNRIKNWGNAVSTSRRAISLVGGPFIIDGNIFEGPTNTAGVQDQAIDLSTPSVGINMITNNIFLQANAGAAAFNYSGTKDYTKFRFINNFTNRANDNTVAVGNIAGTATKQVLMLSRTINTNASGQDSFNLSFAQVNEILITVKDRPDFVCTVVSRASNGVVTVQVRNIATGALVTSLSNILLSVFISAERIY